MEFVWLTLKVEVGKKTSKFNSKSSSNSNSRSFSVVSQAAQAHYESFMSRICIKDLYGNPGYRFKKIGIAEILNKNKNILPY